MFKRPLHASMPAQAQQDPLLANKETVPTNQDTQHGLPCDKGMFEYPSYEADWLLEQLEGAHYAHADEFAEFDEILGLPADGQPTQMDRCLKKLSKGGLARQSRGNWGLTLRKPRREKELYKPLEKVLNTIRGVFSPKTPTRTRTNSTKHFDPATGFDGTQHPNMYGLKYQVANTVVSHLSGAPTHPHRPGLCLMAKDSNSGVTGHHWRNVILPIEIKPKAQPVKLQCATQAHILLSVQDCRIFTYSMSITYPTCRVYLRDRSGCMSSEAFDINSDWGLKRLISVVGRFSQMSLEEHGFDSTAFSIRNQKPHPPFMSPLYIRHHTNEIFRLHDRLTPFSDLFGKESRCWNATQCSYTSPRDVAPMSETPMHIIKESWLHDELDENDDQRGEPQIPVEATTPFTQHTLREDMVWSDSVNAVEPEIPEEPNFDDGYEAGLYKYLNNMGEIPRLARFSGGQKMESTFRNIRKSLGPSEDPGRTRYRVFLNTVGRPLRHSKNPKELLQTIRDIVDALEALCHRGVLHRDISDTNCLIDSNTNRGFLTDLDHAITIKRLNSLVGRSQQHRTGTAPFMAAGILQDPAEPHTWAHDYESIFWLLLWICAGSPLFGQGSLAQQDVNLKVLRVFFDFNTYFTSAMKQHFLYGSPPRLQTVKTHPYFAPINGCLTELQELFYRHRAYRDEDRKMLTPATFRDVLSKWIVEMENKTFDSTFRIETHDGRYRPRMIFVGMELTPMRVGWGKAAPPPPLPTSNHCALAGPSRKRRLDEDGDGDEDAHPHRTRASRLKRGSKADGLGKDAPGGSNVNDGASLTEGATTGGKRSSRASNKGNIKSKTRTKTRKA